jgi:hypothetical protein
MKKSDGMQAKVPEECPREVLDLIQRCLQPIAGDRPTAAEIVTCLKNLLMPQA